MQNPLATVGGTVHESPSALREVSLEQLQEESTQKHNWGRFGCQVCQEFVYRDYCTGIGQICPFFLLVMVAVFALGASIAFDDYRWEFEPTFPDEGNQYQYEWLDAQGQKLLDLSLRSLPNKTNAVVVNSWSNASGWGTEVASPLPHGVGDLLDRIIIQVSDSGWQVFFDSNSNPAPYFTRTPIHMGNRLPWTSFASLAYNTSLSHVDGPTTYHGQANVDVFWHRFVGKWPTSDSGGRRFVVCFVYGFVLLAFVLGGIASIQEMGCRRIMVDVASIYTSPPCFCSSACKDKHIAFAQDRAHNSGVTVHQIVSLWLQIKDDMLDYASCHYVDKLHKHVCKEAKCRFGDHRGVDFTRKGTPPLNPMEPNMHLVVSRYVKHMTAYKGPLLPESKRKGCSYATFVNGDSPLPATHFVSHCWDHNFENFATALKPCGEETAVWVCSFALNQHGDIQEMLSHAVTESPFALALVKANKVLLVIDEKALPLTRSWCVFEIWLAKSHGTQPLIAMDLTLGAEPLYLLEKNVKQLDLCKCTASKQDDHDRIMEAVDDVEALNTMVRGCVEDACFLARSMSNMPQSPSRAGKAGASTMLPFDISDP